MFMRLVLPFLLTFASKQLKKKNQQSKAAKVSRSRTSSGSGRRSSKRR